MLGIWKKKRDTLVPATLKDVNSKTTTWINARSPNQKELEQISKATGIKLHDLKEYLDPDERPKILELEKYSVIVFGAVVERRCIKTTPLAIFVSKNNVVTFRTQEIPALGQIGKLPAHLRNFETPSKFVALILDLIVEEYFRVFEDIEDEVEKLEHKVLRKSHRDIMSHVFRVKKTLIYFHRTLAANREVLAGIEKQYLKHVIVTQSLHYREIYNDIVQLIDSNETHREILTGIIDIHLSTVSNNMNLVMKQLTAWASLILVPTLITGIYGMNFNPTTSYLNMPELNWVFGYPFALGLMFVSFIVLYRYFKKKDWL